MTANFKCVFLHLKLYPKHVQCPITLAVWEIGSWLLHRWKPYISFPVMWLSLFFYVRFISLEHATFSEVQAVVRFVNIYFTAEMPLGYLPEVVTSYWCETRVGRLPSKEKRQNWARRTDENRKLVQVCGKVIKCVAGSHRGEGIISKTLDIVGVGSQRKLKGGHSRREVTCYDLLRWPDEVRGHGVRSKVKQW